MRESSEVGQGVLCGEWEGKPEVCNGEGGAHHSVCEVIAAPSERSGVESGDSRNRGRNMRLGRTSARIPVAEGWVPLVMATMGHERPWI